MDMKQRTQTLGVKMANMKRMNTLQRLRIGTKSGLGARQSSATSFGKNRKSGGQSVWKEGLSNRETAAWSIAPGELPTGSAGIWVKDEDVQGCMVCHKVFSKLNRKHHCRCCGKVICSGCSEHKIRLKVGGQPRRVCTPCYHLQLHAPQRKTAVQAKNRWITVPDWADPSLVDQCFKCYRTPNSATQRFLSHCRACGNLYCGSCTQDIEVPPSFRKEDIQGPVPVCDLCRAAIADGAELVDEAPLPPPLENTESSIVTRKGYVLVLWDIKGKSKEKKKEEVVGRRRTRAVHDEKDQKQLEEDIKRDSESLENNISFIAKVPCQPNTPLPRIHKYLMRGGTGLDRWNDDHTAYSYMCKGKPIPRSHYQVFEARHFVPALYVRSNKQQRKSIEQRKKELHAEFKKQQTQNIDNKRQVSIISTAKTKEDPETVFTTPSFQIIVTDSERKGIQDTGLPPGWDDRKRAWSSASLARSSSMRGRTDTFLDRNRGVDMSKIDDFSKKAAERFGLYLEKNRNIEIIDIMDGEIDLPPPPSGPAPKAIERPKSRKPSAETRT